MVLSISINLTPRYGILLDESVATDVHSVTVGAFRLYTMNQLLLASIPWFEAPMSAEQDLLASIFASDQAYPWQPNSPDGEAYLSRLESELGDDPVVDEAVTAGWNSVSALLATQWANTNTATVERLLTALKAEFEGRMPEAALATIAATAANLVQSSRPVAEQLVETVKAILPSWDTGDLVVLARPLAYSLRDGRGEILDLSLRSTPRAEWGSLTDVEKARLSLAIASVALNMAKEEN